jgi:hypothetical protein
LLSFFPERRLTWRERQSAQRPSAKAAGIKSVMAQKSAFFRDESSVTGDGEE